ncbi:unnamed protein product, partial [Citrullus colocynthis]
REDAIVTSRARVVLRSPKFVTPRQHPKNVPSANLVMPQRIRVLQFSCLCTTSGKFATPSAL